MNLLKKLAHDEEGASLLEYTILIGLITVVVIGIIVGLGSWVGNRWAALCNAIKTAPGGSIVGTCAVTS